MFGRPLVEPIDDLPVGGSFPQALEVLADDFVASGYDLATNHGGDRHDPGFSP